MRTWTLLLLATACGGAEPDDTSPQGPEPGCLSAPARISLVNNESSKPVTQRVSVSNTCGAEVTAALALEGGDGDRRHDNEDGDGRHRRKRPRDDGGR